MLATASQTIVWRIPSTIFVAVPDDDVYSETIVLSDQTSWRFCVRPCTKGHEDALEPLEAERIERSTNNSENYIGVWLQNLDTQPDMAIKSHGMTYSLSLVTATKRVISSMNDVWDKSYWQGTRGTYWFATYEEISRLLDGRDNSLCLIFSCSFPNMGGKFVSFWTASRQMQDDVVYLRCHTLTLPVHAMLLKSSNLHLRYRSYIQVGHVLGSTSLRAFVEFLYDPCESVLMSQPTEILKQVYTACSSFRMRTLVHIIVAALQSPQRINCFSELLAVNKILGKDKDWSPTFWSNVHRLIVSAGETWDRECNSTVRRQLVKAVIKDEQRLMKFVALRPRLLASYIENRENCVRAIIQKPYMAKALAKAYIHSIVNVAEDPNLVHIQLPQSTALNETLSNLPCAA